MIFKIVRSIECRKFGWTNRFYYKKLVTYKGTNLSDEMTQSWKLSSRINVLSVFCFPMTKPTNLSTSTTFSITELKAAIVPITGQVGPPPAIHYSDKQAKSLEATKKTQLYVNNVSIWLPVSVNDTSTCDKVATLFATMQCVDPSLSLLLLKEEKSKLPVILNGLSSPTEIYLLRNNLTIPSFKSKSEKVHCYF